MNPLIVPGFNPLGGKYPVRFNAIANNTGMNKTNL